MVAVLEHALRAFASAFKNAEQTAKLVAMHEQQLS
jgi:hypothetical protein